MQMWWKTAHHGVKPTGETDGKNRSVKQMSAVKAKTT